MKKLLSVVLVGSLLLGVAVFPTTAASLEVGTAYNRADLVNQGYAYTVLTTDNAKILGRSNADTPFTFGWVNNGIEIDFTGTTLGIEATRTETSASYPQKCYAVIDGEMVVEFKLTQQGTSTYILATGLSNTKHTAKILRMAEGWEKPLTFNGIITDGGTTISKTPDRDLKIQFIGDSLTAAYTLSNGTYGYAYKTAEMLGADLNSLASAGGHMYDILLNDGRRYSDGPSTQGGNDGRESMFYASYHYTTTYPIITKGKYTINTDDYSFTYEQTNSAKYNYKYSNDYDLQSFVPDIVVINLGSNDINIMTQSYTNQKWEENKKGFVKTYVNLLKLIGKNYPNVKIVCAYGMMSVNQTMLDLVKEAVAEYNSLPEHAETVAFEMTPKIDVSTDNSHPGLNSNVAAANELTAFIKSTFAIGEQEYTADNNGKVTLPERVERSGAIFTGWFKENGEAFDIDSTLAPNSKITLTPKYVSLDSLDGFVDKDGNVNDDNPVPTNAKYTNGLYIQGAQVRTPLDEKGANSLGLRFVTVVSEEVLETLKSVNGVTNVKYGTLVASSKTSTTTKLENGMQGVSAVYAAKIWQSATELESNYQKYTACVTNIPEKHLSTTLIVRPFISYTDANGVDRCLYGEVYSTASLFNVARAAYMSGVETQAVSDYLHEHIISIAKGDNDTSVEF